MSLCLSSPPDCQDLSNMQADTSRVPTYTVPCEDYVHVVEFSPFSSGTPSSLLAYGGNQYVVVGTCLFQVLEPSFWVIRPALYWKSLLPKCLFVVYFWTHLSCRKRIWRWKELNLMFCKRSIMNCVLTHFPGAPSPDWTSYLLSGIGSLSTRPISFAFLHPYQLLNCVVVYFYV